MVQLVHREKMDGSRSGTPNVAAVDNSTHADDTADVGQVFFEFMRFPGFRYHCKLYFRRVARFRWENRTARSLMEGWVTGSIT